MKSAAAPTDNDEVERQGEAAVPDYTAGSILAVTFAVCLPASTEPEAELLSCRAAVPQSGSGFGETQRSERVHGGSGQEKKNFH